MNLTKHLENSKIKLNALSSPPFKPIFLAITGTAHTCSCRARTRQSRQGRSLSAAAAKPELGGAAVVAIYPRLTLTDAAAATSTAATEQLAPPARSMTSFRPRPRHTILLLPTAATVRTTPPLPPPPPGLHNRARQPEVAQTSGRWHWMMLQHPHPQYVSRVMNRPAEAAVAQ